MDAAVDAVNRFMQAKKIRVFSALATKGLEVKPLADLQRDVDSFLRGNYDLVNSLSVLLKKLI